MFLSLHCMDLNLPGVCSRIPDTPDTGGRSCHYCLHAGLPHAAVREVCLFPAPSFVRFACGFPQIAAPRSVFF